MSEFVLDASAVLALVNDEPGAARVMQALGQVCIIGAVNQSEVLTRLVDRGMSVEEASEVVAALQLPVRAFDEALAVEAAALRGATRRAGLSLGDRACLALAKLRGATALTADRPWMQLDLGIAIECIRPDA